MRSPLMSKVQTSHQISRINMSIPIPPDQVDYSLYLVTDSSPEFLRGRSLAEVVEQALKGGVTVVQYRNKHADTAIMIKEATELLKITRSYNVPLMINDRLDVALAVGADGLHIGQDDLGMLLKLCLLKM